jgi:hypothetical protein
MKTGKIIEVSSPTFYIEKNNPENVKYFQTEKEWRMEKDGDYKAILVESFIEKLPIPQKDEILYKYKDNRGYLLKLTKSGIRDVQCQTTETFDKKTQILILTYAGEGDPVIALNKARDLCTQNKKYNEFMDMNMDNPWVRIIKINND